MTDVKSVLDSFNLESPEGIETTLDTVSIAATIGYEPNEDIGYLDRSEKNPPVEPFELFSDIEVEDVGTSAHPLSYAIEYTALGNRREIRNLKADTFKIEDITNFRPSRSSFDPYLIDDIFDGRSIPYNQNEFISIDIQPYIADKLDFVGISNYGIDNYTSVYSRPDLWRIIDNNDASKTPEQPYVGTDLESLKHFVAIPPDERSFPLPDPCIGTSIMGRSISSTLDREYGFYFRHYDNEPGYWTNEGIYCHWETYLSDNNYGFYYGKVPDGKGKKFLSELLDINGNYRYQLYDSSGRWGIYIDDEVKNYIEGRVLIGHNIDIGIGKLATEKEPIVSIFNNKYKDQYDVEDPETEFQAGLFVEDFVGIGTRVDTRYRLNVDASVETGAGVFAPDFEQAARFVGNVFVESGSIGIGTTNPLASLDVRDDVIMTSNIIAGINTYTGIVLTSPNGSKFRLYVDDSGAVLSKPYP